MTTFDRMQAVCAILDAASAAGGEEICGLLVDDGGLRFIQAANAADDRRQSFEITAEDWARAEAAGRVCAVVHSHPGGEPFLSGADRQMQVQTGLPWILAAGGRLKAFRCCPHLRGRVFEYGHADCGTLVRDAFMLMGLDLPDHPRGDMDADASADYWQKHLARIGFVRVSDGLEGGDVVLTAYGGHANHAALYLGGGEILHHAYNQLSRREAYNQWWQERTHSVWRHPEFEPPMMRAVENDLLHRME